MEASKAKMEEKADKTEHPTTSQARRSVRRSVRHMPGSSDADLAGSTFKEEIVIESNRKKTAPVTNTPNGTENDVFTCTTPVSPVSVVGKKDCMKTPSPPSLFFNRVTKIKSKRTKTKRRISNDKICGGDILKDISNTHKEPKKEKQVVVVKKPESVKTNDVKPSSRRNKHGIDKRPVKTKTVLKDKDISNSHTETEPKLEKQVVVEEQVSGKTSKFKVTSRRKNQGQVKNLTKPKTVPKIDLVESKISSQEEEMKEKVPVKRQRRSYSMGDTDHRFSLDGSNKNSILAVSGEREIDISMPEAVRRSLTGQFVPHRAKPNFYTPKRNGDSGSEEEEIISGNLSRKRRRKARKLP